MINYLHMPNSDMNPNTNDLNSKNKENDLKNFIEFLQTNYPGQQPF